MPVLEPNETKLQEKSHDAQAASAGVGRCPPAQLPKSSGSSGGGSDRGAEFGEPRGERANTVPGQTEIHGKSNDPYYGAWREADDLILFKIPGHEEFRLSNKAAERLFDDFAKICGKRSLEKEAQLANTRVLQTLLSRLFENCGTADKSIRLNGDSYRYMAEKIAEYSDGMDSLKVAERELLKVAAIVDDAERLGLSSHAPESSRDSSSPKTAGVLNKGGRA